jgi:hypothetical protein
VPLPLPRVLREPLIAPTPPLACPPCIGPSYLHACGGDAQLVRPAWLPRTTERPAHAASTGTSPSEAMRARKSNIPRFVMRHLDKEGRSNGAIRIATAEFRLAVAHIVVERLQPCRLFGRRRLDPFTVLSRSFPGCQLTTSPLPKRGPAMIVDRTKRRVSASVQAITTRRLPGTSDR